MPSARPSKAVETEPFELSEGDLNTNFQPSQQQMDIFRWFQSGRGNLIVRARAGTGKTTTILRGIGYAPEDSILLCAFNKRIQEELELRLENPCAKAQTLHSIGFQAIRNELGRVWLAQRTDRADFLAKSAAPWAPAWLLRLIARLVTRSRELIPNATDPADFLDLAVDFDILPEPWSDVSPYQFAELVAKAQEIAARTEPSMAIDYADMIFLPLKHGWLRPVYDLVVVDEAQDMTEPQLEMAQRVCDGRIVIVGDDRQAIYGFRGADSSSLDRLKATLHAEELGLMTTYRCPKSVVEVAKTYVQDYQVADTAPVGIVDTVDTLDQCVDAVKPGDFILSRKNAPLMPIALMLLRRNIPARVQGKDVGAGLRNLVNKIATGHAASSIPEFLGKLRAWEEREITRLKAMDRADRIGLVMDKADTLRALGQEAKSVNTLLGTIDLLFADSNPRPQVVCSTVHKAKGLESRRVFVLRKTLNPPIPCECGHFHGFGPCKRCQCASVRIDTARQLEETNIAYVAVTRAMEHLTWVNAKI